MEKGIKKSGDNRYSPGYSVIGVACVKSWFNIHFIFSEKNNKTMAPSALMLGRLSYFSSGVDALCLTNYTVG
ncbi:hypothetical protein [Paenibacillus cucumis (ex Kampfer et al. 2016)]|uniref:Uncharacterized protein n=1 Tax=Paenibacillus cucumis (ex Kampfer et al. 2016) TaxID=1776858 RepID=A0ABS7KSB0_9BACL|nr:hypothetical protein [Paenibacillus cucumis (ex Kampfer et al. 2016)]MBY0207048.1 hypothetical protein [Paenibacillus cucumis (ex Kampfer et al. 2016)]